MLFLEYLSNPYVIAVLSGILTYILMYLDCKISKSKRSTLTYCKNISYVSLLTGILVYILNNEELRFDAIDTQPPDF